MIQRKQTLYLLLVVFLGASLMFIPVGKVLGTGTGTPVYLVPFIDPGIISTMGHTAAIALNFFSLILSFTVVFLYKKRQLQVRLSYFLVLIWLSLGGMIAFCPFVQKSETVSGTEIYYYTLLITGAAVVATWMAIRSIKKDIELLRSADRIR